MSDPNCDKCHGKGNYECTTCHGEKQVVCEKCKGRGVFKNCIKCNSTGKEDCATCEGTGKDYSICSVCCGNGYIKKTRLVNCKKCFGKGFTGYHYNDGGKKVYETCFACGGSGQLKESYREICPRCNGAKRIYNERPCPSCGGTLKVECSRCEGTGKARCQECGGSGKVTCKTCHGDGTEKCPDCEKKEKEAEERRQEKEREIRAREDAKRRKANAIRAKREEEERKAKERKDAAQGCGCLLAIIALVIFGIWWWIEGFSMSAITDLWTSNQSTIENVVSTGQSNSIVDTVKVEPSPTNVAEDAAVSLNGVGKDGFAEKDDNLLSDSIIENSQSNMIQDEGGIIKDAYESMGTVGSVLICIVVLFVGLKVIRKIFAGNNSDVTESDKKRWMFIFLGVILGFFGAHLAYAKRWLLFLLLWAGFICGNVMNEKKTTEGAPDAPPTVQEQNQEVSTEGDAQESEKKSSNPISNAGFAVWGLLWIGGTLFIKKDGNGCRM
jgi:F0F1-type ATP synthase assembly protein I